MSQEEKNRFRQRMKMNEDKDYDGIAKLLHPDFKGTNSALVNCVDLSRDDYLTWLRSFFDGIAYSKFDLIRLHPAVDPFTSIAEYKLTFKYDKDILHHPDRAKGQEVVAYGMLVNKIDPNTKLLLENRVYATYYWDGGAPDIKVDDS